MLGYLETSNYTFSFEGWHFNWKGLQMNIHFRATMNKQDAAQKKREAASARDSARMKQREAEKYDQKAEHTTRQAKQLTWEREAVL